eukprot:TRINITY_DN935_c6_g1_i1.p1 TRINITY_DN935_c6_g1~~TRINITY_DN935_c6_g1_i1.p1  ORF type:complete len:637 (+),score=252.98 TRINITY_DN935_c6_g1_i1:269-2179(+)
MALSKRLSTDIDRTLKKVQEGIILFEEIWEKLHCATQANLKERFQGDLKTEIKKLQRLRDQIKTWQGMAEIRDKRAIDEARRNIEAKMENFKACERDAKIKTYSKVGLSLPTKEDPEEAARERAREWLNDNIGQLGQQLEVAEAEADGAGGRKKRGGRAAADAELREKIARHRFHIGKLEGLLRLLDNEQVTPGSLDDIREDVEEYVQHGQDPDYVDNEDMYDEIAPMDVEDAFLEGQAAAPAAAESKKEKKAREEKKEEPPRREEREPRKKKEKGRDSDSKSTPSSTPVHAPGTPTAPAPSNLSLGKGSAHGAASTGSQSPLRAQAPAAPKAPPQTQNYAQVAKQAASTKPAAKASKSAGSTPQGTPTHAPSQPASAPPAMDGPGSSATRRERPQPLDTRADGMPRAASGDARAAGSPLQARKADGRALQSDSSSQPSPQASSRPGQGGSGSVGRQPAAQQAAPLQQSTGRLAGAAPAASPAATAARREEDAAVQRLLAQSASNLPQPEDTRKRQPYVPLNPFRTPKYYPQQPHSVFDSPEIFRKFAADTLFFIFYYQQSTYQQYIAARELKRQSWRFHKRSQMWFQRADPPTQVNEEYEQGTYLYFDFQDGWSQRYKKDFTFKYCQLEDDLPQH